MNLRSHFLILTAEELTSRNAPTVESNCACPEPGDGFTLTHAIFVTGSSYQLPTLHLDELPPKHHLAFNPLGRHGVAVLNQPTLNLLHAFRQPHSLAEGARLAGNPPDGLPTVQRLA